MTETETEQVEDPAVEPVEPVEDPGEQGEPEPDEDPDEHVAEPEAVVHGPTEAEMEARFDKISRSFKTYQASVERNLEEGALDLVPCPLCFSTAHPSFLNKHDAGRVPEEIQDAVRTFFGLAREQDYEPDPEVRMCPTCKGKRRTKTGAVSGDEITRPCPTCKGHGYIPPPGRTVVSQSANGAHELTQLPPTDDFEAGERDNWGEPRILPDGTLNDNFGKMPQFKSVHPVYGVTANLNVFSEV